MPAQPFIDLSTLDFDNPQFTIEDIRKINPHRFEFENLTAVVMVNEENGTLAAYRDIREDEYWVRGHIPGRPIFPGVLMIESAAQMCSFQMGRMVGTEKFIGFGGVDGVKFRGQVTPPCRLVLLGKVVEFRPRRVICDCQGFVNGTMVFEGRITGMPI